MARTKYTAEFYRTALKGDGEYKGLRKYAKGFDAKDGYSLRDIDKWTAAQKRKVREYVKEISELRARGSVVYRSRSDANLRKAQEAARHPKELKQLKVAFIPGAFKPEDKPRIRITKEGLSLTTRKFEKMFLPFDVKALARDPEGEVLRIAAEAEQHGMQHFQIVTGKHTLAPMYHDMESAYEAITQLMHQYDGKKPLPQGSGNRGDLPHHHHWREWLRGVDAFNFGPRGDPNKFLREQELAREANRRARHAQREALRRAQKQSTARGKRASKTKGKR